MTDWHALAAEVDLLVDGQFGEPISFTAWKQPSSYATGSPDSSRIIPAAVGCYINSAARVMPAPGAVILKAANTDLLFSIRDAYLVGVRQGDHVYLSDRMFYGEIAFIEPGDTDRSILHLLRLKGETPVTVVAGQLLLRPQQIALVTKIGLVGSAFISINGLAAEQLDDPDNNYSNIAAQPTRDAGNRYFEALFELGVDGSDVAIGLAKSPFPTNDVTSWLGANVNEIGLWITEHTNNTSGAGRWLCSDDINSYGEGLLPADTNPVVVGVDVNFTTGALGFSFNGVRGGNVESFSFEHILRVGNWFPAASLNEVGDRVTFNLAGPFVYPIPDGYGAWLS